MSTAPPSARSMPPASPREAEGAREGDMAGLPQKFGKYTLIRKLAAGGMAELFLAIQKSVAGFEKLLVIKRILPQMNQDQAFIEMLLHEARVAATLSHANIVQIFDVGEVGGVYYIAMEHVHGEDLRQIVRQMKRRGVLEFPLEHALAIILGVCAGLAYAHERRDLDGTPLHIVHRDISPQNVVVTFTGDVKIVDFGIAKSDRKIGEATRSGKLKGKVPYMSPEQARGDTLDARSDIFSAGVMLFELTTGKRLFKAQSEYETLRLICEVDYPRPSDVVPGYPPELEAIVMRALEKDPAARYQSAREMQGAIQSFVRTRQIAVSDIGLQDFMQLLFAEKLAVQKEMLMQGKQLADIIEMQAQSSLHPDSTMEMDASAVHQASSLSMPAASRTVTTLSTPGHRQRRLAALLTGVVVLGAMGGVVGYALIPKPQVVSPARPAPASEARAVLVVDSDPPGAAIWLNGSLRPERTPATLEQLPTDSALDVKVTQEGFEEARRTVTLRGGDRTAVRLELQRGVLSVDLRVTPPVSGHVVLDGASDRIALSGGAARIDGLAAGVDHTLTVDAPGFDAQSLAFRGEARERKALTMTLSKAGGATAASSAAITPTTTAKPPVAGAGKLNVGASGGWCNVSVDGKPRGATPVAGIELAAGAHKVSCVTEDGKAQTATVQVGPGETVRHKFSLH